MSMKHEKVEMDFKVLFRLKDGSKSIRKAMLMYIREARKQEINLIAYETMYIKEHLIVSFRGEKISRIGRLLRMGRWIPKRLTLVEVIDFQDRVEDLISAREEQFYRKYKVKYNIKLISQTMPTGDKKTLVILLAEQA
mgnify:FL=1